MLRLTIILGWMTICVGYGYAQYALPDYIRAARQNSPLINDNKNQAQINGLEIDRLKAFYTKSQIGLTANYAFSPIVSTDNGHTRFVPNPKAATDYYGYDVGASNGGVYQALVTFTQPLFNGGKYKAYARQADVGRQANENTILLTGHDIEKVVTDQYILCLLDKNQMLFADSLLSLIREQTAIVKKLVESSILKQSDLSLLNIEYQNNLGLLATYKATYRRDVMDLNVLCGINDTAFVLLDDMALQPTVNPPPSSNYLAKYRLDSLSIQAAQKVLETKYRPQLSFYANAGLNAVYAPSIPNRFGASLGLTFSWMFYDGGQKSISRNKTDLQLQTVSAYRNNFLDQNAVRKNKLLTELRSYDERETIARNQLQEYASLLAYYRKEIVQGQLSILNYITVLKNMTAAKRDYFVLETNRLLLTNAYNYWNW